MVFFLFVVNIFLRKLLQNKYLQPLFLTMAVILDAILDFSARTNFRQCIPLVSQTTGYKVHFGICHVLLYFYEHPTFTLALKVTLLIGVGRFRIFGGGRGGARFTILGGGGGGGARGEAKFPAGT